MVQAMVGRWHADFRYNSYSKSQSWLKHFKKKHSIQYLKASVEKLSADKEAADEFINDFVHEISDENLSLELIFQYG